MTPIELENLKSRIARGESFTFRPFYGHTPRADGKLSDACFSQWWKSPFIVDGVTYFTAEHYMMAAKARLFGDEQALAKILAEEEPSKVKAIGREVKGFVDTKWAAARFDAVTQGSIAKFSSTPELKAYLLSTGDEILVEAAPRDRIWGIGLGRENPLVKDPSQWRGLNLLGFALVRARAALRT
jgi:hypothetical protein